MIPCCADLDRVGGDRGGVERARAGSGSRTDRSWSMSGKLTEPYMDREMVEFFAIARRAIPGLAFLVLTQAPPASIRSEFVRAGIPDADYRILRAEPAELGSYLGLADFAICFCRPSFARIASSPTKLGEYLGAGLPVASGPGIGDVDEILDGRGVGVIVDAFGEPGYERAAKRIRELAADPDARARCRAVAREVFSLDEVGIPRYDRLYRRLAGLVERGPGATAMRVGYAPYDASLSQPADRRRFPFYAERRGIQFELADPSREYDLVVVTPRADLGAWSRYRPGRSKLVFDIVDSYLAIPRTNLKAILGDRRSSPPARRAILSSATAARWSRCWRGPTRWSAPPPSRQPRSSRSAPTCIRSSISSRCSSAG